MNPWPFVIAAYTLVAVVVGTMLVLGWRAMRRAEAAADRRDR